MYGYSIGYDSGPPAVSKLTRFGTVSPMSEGIAVPHGNASHVSDLETIGFTNQEDDKYGQLAVVDIPREVAARQPWFNQTLTTVNDAVVRLGIFQGEFPWHKHDDQDEFFLVLEGELYMDAEGLEPVHLKRHQGFTVPKGTMHRPRSPEKSVVLMVERVGIAPTGD